MSLLRKTIILAGMVVSMLAADPAAITNVQFTDDKGNEYDLFELLDRGTHVYIELVDNN